MPDCNKEQAQILRPLLSLISKSEKARLKLAPGTWQHRMLDQNLKALHMAVQLMNQEAENAPPVRQAELLEALDAFEGMISRSEKAHASFAPGTSQHTLLENRIQALCAASQKIREQIQKKE